MAKALSLLCVCGAGGGARSLKGGRGDEQKKSLNFSVVPRWKENTSPEQGVRLRRPTPVSLLSGWDPPAEGQLGRTWSHLLPLEDHGAQGLKRLGFCLCRAPSPSFIRTQVPTRSDVMPSAPKCMEGGEGVRQRAGWVLHRHLGTTQAEALVGAEPLPRWPRLVRATR